LLTGREQGHGGNDQGIFQGEHFRWTFSPNPSGGYNVPAKNWRSTQSCSMRSLFADKRR
jgi:hypothetical protein